MKFDYDVAVIGGGAAGLVAATGCAMSGAKTAMIEANKLGGDCTWYGCVPSKALLRSAHVFSLAKRLGDFGIGSSEPVSMDASKILDHVRTLVKQISEHHPVELFQKRGITVEFGKPSFTGERAIELEGKTITAKRFIVCTGSHPLIPPIQGLNAIDYLTNENIFELKTLPDSLIIAGSGPIGTELAQAFCRLGVKIWLVELSDSILPREDRDVSAVLAQALSEEGVNIITGSKVVEFGKENGNVTITLENKEKKRSTLTAQKTLIALGRQANVKGLNLEKAGIKYTDKGIIVDAFLRTTNRNVFAAGDVAGPYQFSHMAEYQAIMALSNALLPFKRKADYSAVAWCTFTDPEVARLGLTEQEARSRHKDIKIYKSEYAANDRAVTDGETRGLAKVICDKKGRILGAHIAGANAGDLIAEYTLAKSSRLRVSAISRAIHVYPTLSQISKRCADQYLTEFLANPWLKKAASFFIRRLR